MVVGPRERERAWVLLRCAEFLWRAEDVAACKNPKSPPQNPAVRAYGRPGAQGGLSVTLLPPPVSCHA